MARWLRARGIEAYVIHPASIAVSREHRRAKTDRLDTELLMRAFLGWLRGEKRHCSMAAIPTVEEEDARRPNRERENLVAERTRIVNQMKAILARFGIRGFKPTLRKAAEKLDGLRTAEGTPLVENTRAELSRHLARLRVVREQIRAIEQNVCTNSRQPLLRRTARMSWFGSLRGVFGVGVETADMLVNEVFARHLRDRMFPPWLPSRDEEWVRCPGSFAADAYDCIMVPILTDRPNTRMRAIFAPDSQLPSELSSSVLTTRRLTNVSLPPSQR